MVESNKKSIKFLPDYLQTDKNAKFLSSTLDELIKDPELERIDGYVGSKLLRTFDPKVDFYLNEITDRRSAYQFFPALVFKDSVNNITDTIFYEDILNRLTIEGAYTENHDRLFNSILYSYAPPIDIDKFANYDQYYWLPDGPDPVIVPSENFISTSSFEFTNGIVLSNGMKIVTTQSYVSNGFYITSNTEYLVEGVGSGIQLIKFDDLKLNSNIAQVIDETYDSAPFDYYGFDSDSPEAVVPEYVTINKASNDLNPWSRYNRWFHAEVIRSAAEYNNTLPIYDNKFRANRPIIEFNANLQLYNFGERGIGYVDLIDDNLINPIDDITGKVGFYIDNVLLEKNYRIIFNSNSTVADRSKIYIVNFATGTNTIYLTQDLAVTISDRDSIYVTQGKKYTGKSFYFDDVSNVWVESQDKTKLNQAPLFNLYDADGTELNNLDTENDFQGNKLFGYKLGQGTNDSVLGFPISYNQNLVGIGSFEFQNYLGTDYINVVSDSVSVEKSVAEYYFKIRPVAIGTQTPVLKNIYGSAFLVNERVVNSIVMEENTTSFYCTAFDNPITTPIRVQVEVNNILTTSTYSIDSKGIKLTVASGVKKDDYVNIFVSTTQTPNSNGYYFPINSLLHNTFNENVSSLSFVEITGHIYTMVIKDAGFIGQFPGSSNLRDRPYMSDRGHRIVMQSNSISFLQLFLGKSDINVINSTRWVANNYSFFKQNLIRKIEQYNYVNDPVSALDDILTELGTTKLSNQSFFNSDMVGFGNTKIVKSYEIVSQLQRQFPLPEQFDLQRLSYQSVYVYYLGTNLTHGQDYEFDYDTGTINILLSAAQFVVGETFEVHFYTNTLGNFIPPTPTKLGLYPSTKPKIVNDYRYAYGYQSTIVGHDGSIEKAFGDYRDLILLEYELRVFNNLKVHYDANIFNIFNKVPGSFRNTNFNQAEFNNILEKEYTNWAVKNGIEVGKNTTYDGSNNRTHNFRNVVDNITNKVHNGTYRSILKDLYDTDRPHSHPWECLKFTDKPDWWDSTYTTNYGSTNTAMWTDIFNGLIVEPGNVRTLPFLIRASALPLIDRIPADASGNLRSIDSFLVNPIAASRNNSWIFGDHSPAEVAWRNSSVYPYALQICMALLSPLDYAGRLFDVSRVYRNISGQWIWKDDNLYLSPKKLLVEGYDTDSSAGYGNFILEYGTFIDKDYRRKLSENLKNLDSNLAYKLGGYSTKEKLRIKINAVDPGSNSPGLILPNEDYQIKLYQSDPIQQFDISGFIIQRVQGGYSIRGYNRYNSFFKIYKPIYSTNSRQITIGGIAEPYTQWQPYYGDETGGLTAIDISSSGSYSAKFYKQGQLVFYNSKFYRVTVSHTAGRTFKEEFFAKLNQQPISGGVSVNDSDIFESTVTNIYYGSEFANVQDIYDIIIGYGHYLESIGFVFDNYNRDLLEILNWKFSAREFLYWSSQNWAVGNLITLSPFADSLKFVSKNYLVENLFKKNVEYFLQNADGRLFPKENIDVVRYDGEFILNVKNSEDGLFFASIKIVQKEHILVLNNTTIFNDTILDRPSGYRQGRIKLTGFRTKNWNGDLSNPGFLFYPGNYTDWEPYAAYNIGDIVRFNGQYYQANKNIIGSQSFEFSQWNQLYEKYNDVLLPNFEYKINQFEDFYSLDIDNFDYEQQKFAQHLIGYSPRPYLDKLITDPIAQYKFYQGFVKEKGTLKALENILKIGKNKENSSIEIQEEWAIRTGEFGSYSSINEIEIPLKENKTIENPYIISFSNTQTSSGIIQYTSSTDFLILSDNTDITNIFSTASNTVVMGYAGYVRQDDVTGTAYNKNSLLDIANNSLIKNGDTIWLGFLENGSWDVYRYIKQRAKISGVFVQNPGSSITFVTNLHHGLSIGEIVSIVGFNYQVNGVYIVQEIPNLNQFTVASSLAGIENDELVAYGSLLKFERARFANFSDWNNSVNQFNLTQGSKVWIDSDENSRWVVFEKIRNYSTGTQIKASVAPLNQRLGKAIFASTLTNVVLISSPEFHFPGTLNYGAVDVYRKDFNNNLNKLFSYQLNTIENVVQLNTSTDFGYALDFDIAKELYIVGAPKSNQVRATTSTDVLIAVSSQTFVSRAVSSEGVVKISTKNVKNTGELTKIVLAQPYNTLTNANSRFGHSIYINRADLNSSTTLLVGAPGNSRYTYSGNVFAYKVNLFDVESLDFNIDSFVEANRATIGFNDYKNVVISILPFYTSNNSYATSSGLRYGLYRDPDNAGLAYWTNLVINNSIDPTSLSFIDSFFSAVDIQPQSYDYARSFTSNKLYQEKGTIDIVPFFGTNTIQVLSTSSITLNPAARWGYQIAGDRKGENIAISAPNYVDNGPKGIVQIFDKNLNWKQTITSPFTDYDEFGTKVKVSDSGKFIFIGSKKASFDNKTLGRVAVYKKTNESYQLNQIISNPLQNSDLVFSQDIDISENEKVLAISALGTNKSEVVKFYKTVFTQATETTFDSNQTRFITVVPNSGSVFLYQNANDYFIGSDELLPENISEGSDYGYGLNVTDNEIYVGAPTIDSYIKTEEISSFYQFKILDKNKQVWNRLRYQEDLIDVSKINKISRIDLENEELVDYIDIFDPIKGKIPGLADQEIKYKLSADPAVYSIGLSSTVVDTQINWIDDHIGELWWDLSTAKYIWYEQGNEVYRKNNWGKLFPGASIDVYEWVRSTLLPSEWAVLADTNKGISKAISGQPKYPDNSVMSVKQVLNTVTGAFENVYFYWVKNKTIVPDKTTRRISALDASRLIADPLSYGHKFIEVLSKNTIALANLGNSVRESLNIVYSDITNNIPKHTEWMLMREGDINSIPNAYLEKKIFDSFVGRDLLGNEVPDPALSFRNRYGLSVRPQQTLFKNRFEALRNIFYFVNTTLSENRITGVFDFDRLLSQEPLPIEDSGEYDLIVEDFDRLDFIRTEKFKQAKLSVTVNNGKIISVSVLDPGYGYVLPPKISINPSNGAELQSVIDTEGRIVDIILNESGNGFTKSPTVTVRSHVVAVEIDSQSGNRWSLYSFNYTFRTWTKFRTQLYNTALYWDYVDFQLSDFDPYKSYVATVGNTFEIEQLTDLKEQDYIKVDNIGDGNFAILRKVQEGNFGNFSKDFDIIYQKDGTIKFKDLLWNSSSNTYGFSKSSLDETLYDQLPDIELYNILVALKNDIFVGGLKIYWNKFFFTVLKYIMSEQQFVDWAFKTSFVVVKSRLNYLDQHPAYSLDNSEYIEDYINEIKPFKTTVRNFNNVSNYLENTNMNFSDFDVPAFFNPQIDGFDTLRITSTYDLSSSTLYTGTIKDWYDNRFFSVKEILISDGGSGYTSKPTVVISGTLASGGYPAIAEALIRNGSVYKIVVTDPGKGYITLPTLNFTNQGGATPARGSVVVENQYVRSTTVGLKFDRYSRDGELGNRQVIFEQVCNGSQIEFELPYKADIDKLNVVVTLNKKLVLGSNYKIEHFSKDINNYNKDYSKFVFVDLIPTQGTFLKVVYNKHIDLYNAIDRINHFYDPTENMVGKNLPLLMKGLEYPYTKMQGLKFDYSTPILSTSTIYDNGGGWSDLTSAYAKGKLRSQATITDQTLSLESVEGILPGQIINFLGTSTIYIRTDTVVRSVDTVNNTIDITVPTYFIASAVSTLTSIGSYIRIDTRQPFNGALRVGDQVKIDGIATGGYNGLYTIFEINDNNTFVVTATSVLSDVSASFTTATVSVCSILKTIPVNNRVIGSINFSLGPCFNSQYSLAASSPAIMEGYTATFTISGSDVYFGTGRVFQYSITGTNITAADFVGGLTGTISSSTLSLPLNFGIQTSSDGSVESVETFYVSVNTWLSTGTFSAVPIGITSMKLRDRPVGPPVYNISASKGGIPITQPVNEGDIITYTITGTNIDFGSNGRIFKVYGSGTNITVGDLTAGVLTATYVPVYSQDDLPIIFDVQITQDLVQEGSENFGAYLETWLNVLEAGTSTYSTVTTITINDSSVGGPVSYALTSNSPVAEGNTLTIGLTTINLPVGYGIPYQISTLTGGISLADLSTSSYSGTLVIGSTGIPFQGYAEKKFTIATDATFEQNESFRFSLTNVVAAIGLISGQSYIDVTLTDQISQQFGQSPSRLLSNTVLESTAFSRIIIESSGTFNLGVATTNAIDPSGVFVTPTVQKWTDNSTGITGYYVRARLDPLEVWQGNATFTGPGFASTIDKAYFDTNGYNQVSGSWVTISSAASTPVSGQLGWYASGNYASGTDAKAQFNLIIEIATSTSGIVIASGTYFVDINGYQTVGPINSSLPGQGNDLRDLL